MSIPSFEKIIDHNQLVKGRLKLSAKKLEIIFRSLQQKKKRLNNKLLRQDSIIEEQIHKHREIRRQLKLIDESIEKSFFPTPDKISILYKNQKGIFYLKARTYWMGIQREVQIGSIPSVISVVNKLIKKNEINYLGEIKNSTVSWTKLQKRPKLIEAIKEVAAFKFQEYILRQLMEGKTISSLNESEEKEIKKGIPNIQEEIKVKPPAQESSIMDENIPGEKQDWYVQWRRNNL